MDCSLPGSSVHGILQARILEWVAISSSRGSSDPDIKPRSPTFQADSLPAELSGKIPGGTEVKNLQAIAGDIRDTGLVPGSGRSPGEGNGNPLQYSGLENPVNRGAWWATFHRVLKHQTRLKQLSTHTQVSTQKFNVFLKFYFLLKYS